MDLSTVTYAAKDGVSRRPGGGVQPPAGPSAVDEFLIRVYKDSLQEGEPWRSSLSALTCRR